MVQQRIGIAATAILLLVFSTAPSAAQSPQPDERNLGERLVEADLADAVADLDLLLAEDPADDQVRFALGMGQFLLSGETLFRQLYRHGFDPDRSIVGWTVGSPQYPLPVSPDPLEISYKHLEQIIGQWQTDLRTAERTLADITDVGVKLRLRIGLVQMDFNDNGELEKDEALFAVFNRAQRRFTATRTGAEEFDIAFDRGDVDWLRGYCHICLALTECALTYDRRDLFERAAHLVFKKPRTPYAFLEHPDPEAGWEQWNTIDFISLVHGIRFDVAEPERLRTALGHLLQAVSMSRGMWDYYNAETDNDREWLPNPTQATIIPGGEVTEMQQEMWLAFLDEAEALLKGERLLRFWRTEYGEDQAEGLGVNVNRALTEPRPFDLVFWVQGTTAQPYLEEGPLTEPQLWTHMEQAFNYHTFRHMFWFN